MLLYLVQHGEAKKEEEDPQRGLTEKGQEAVRKMAEHAAKLNIRVNEIFHSAKLRARQTAMILAEQLKPEKGTDQSDDLLPMDDPDLWAVRLAGMNEDTMLVGHLPFLARLAGLLLCGDKEKTFVDFKTGGIVCLKRIESRWVLAWMVVPEMVR